MEMVVLFVYIGRRRIIDGALNQNERERGLASDASGTILSLFLDLPDSDPYGRPCTCLGNYFRSIPFIRRRPRCWTAAQEEALPGRIILAFCRNPMLFTVFSFIVLVIVGTSTCFASWVLKQYQDFQNL